MMQPLVWSLDDDGNHPELVWWNLFQGRFLAEVQDEKRVLTLVLFDLNRDDAVVATMEVGQLKEISPQLRADRERSWSNLADRMASERKELSQSC